MTDGDRATTAGGTAQLGTEAAASSSGALYARALQVLPGGNTRGTVYRRPFPLYATRGVGSRIVDADGIERVDFVNNYTTLIHGHAHPHVLERVMRVMQDGTCFGLPTETEIQLAEMLCQRLPTVERIRFTNSGSEAVMMALKAARAYTGRTKIAKFEGCYHGSYDYVEVSLEPTEADWGDVDEPASVAYSAGTPAGVLEDVVVLPFNDERRTVAILEEHKHELAGVIFDPLPNRIGFIPARPSFVRSLQEFCSSEGVVLISDEVISFRLAQGGAQAVFGYSADLTTLGKIIGGGFPIGAVGGREDIMSVFDPSSGRARVPHAGTFNANPVSMTAGIASLELLTDRAIHELNRLGESARRKVQGALNRADSGWQVSGQGSLLRILPTSVEVTDYRSGRWSPMAARRMGVFAKALLGRQVLVDASGLVCVSSVMSDSDVDLLATAVEAASREAASTD